MLKAIINLINALADRVRPCKHSWEPLDEHEKWLVENLGFNSKDRHRCTKCGESKIISSK